MVSPDRRLRRLALIPAALVAATTVALAAPPPQQPTPPAPPATDSQPATTNKNVVVLTGCLSGSLLTHVRPKEYVVTVPDSIRITGNRSMRSQLKEANGHAVELTGVLKGLKDDSTGALVKDTGKTKIYVGGTRRASSGDDPLGDQRQIQPPTLDVSTLKDISPQCMETRSE